MEKISPDEILRKQGKWIESSKFVKIVADKRNVSLRQARNIIKNEKKEITKHVFSDRTVIYGLPEFGPPTLERQNGTKFDASEFPKSLVSQFWKEREEVQKLRLEGKLFSAWDRTQRFCEILPDSPKKESILEMIRKVNLEISKKNEVRANLFGKEKTYFLSLSEDEQKDILYQIIPKVWQQIATTINEA